MSKPGPKPLPPEERKICRVILNLYPAEYDDIAQVAMWSDMKPTDVVRWALRIGLPIIVSEVERIGTIDQESG
jgi:hypothetical protein